MSDNLYFKTIRACFSAHPVNLRDYFSGGNEVEQRYASWSGGGYGHGDFSVILYSNQLDISDIFLDIYFDELLNFAEQRYRHLESIIREIDSQETAFLNDWRKRIIPQSDSPLVQIETLLSELKRRLGNDYYNYELNRLKIFFVTSITDINNQAIVDQYRSLLLGVIDEIYDKLQSMDYTELSSTQKLDIHPPEKLRYFYSKLCESVFGSGLDFGFTAEPFKEHLSGIVGLSACSGITVNGSLKMHKKGGEIMYRSGVRDLPFQTGYC